jgi:hypothetical protein
VLAECRGRLLLELRDEADSVSAGDGACPTRTRAWDERPALLSLRQIAVDGTAVQAELCCDRLNRRPIVDGCHDPFTEIEMIGAHAGLPPLTSIASSQPLRKML